MNLSRYSTLVLIVGLLPSFSWAKTWVRENCDLYVVSGSLWSGFDGEALAETRERLKRDGWNLHVLGEGSLETLAGAKAGALLLRDYFGDESDPELNRAGSGKMRAYIDLVELKTDCVATNDANCQHYENLRTIREKGFNVKSFVAEDQHRGWLYDLGKLASPEGENVDQYRKHQKRFAKRIPRCKLASEAGRNAPPRDDRSSKNLPGAPEPGGSGTGSKPGTAGEL